MQETWISSLSREDSLEKGITTHSNILARRIPWTKEPGGLDWVTNFHHIHGHCLTQSSDTEVNHHIGPVWIFGGLDARMCDSRNSLKRKKALRCYSYIQFTHSSIYFLVILHGMWNLSSQTRHRTCAPALEAQGLTTGLPGKSQEFSFCSSPSY